MSIINPENGPTNTAGRQKNTHKRATAIVDPVLSYILVIRIKFSMFIVSWEKSWEIQILRKFLFFRSSLFIMSESYFLLSKRWAVFRISFSEKRGPMICIPTGRFFIQPQVIFIAGNPAKALASTRTSCSSPNIVSFFD